jgi:hypothetical protein
MSDQRPTRRATLAAGAAFALAPAGIATLALTLTPDPVFAAIEAYREAAAKYAAHVRGPFAELEEREIRERQERPNGPQDAPHVKVGHNHPISLVQHTPDGDEVKRIEGGPVYCYDHQSIDEHCDAKVRQAGDDAAAVARIEAGRVRWHAELGAQETTEEIKPRESVEIRMLAGALCDVECNARLAMCATEPTTMAGVLTLLRFVVAEDERDGNQVFSEDELRQLAYTLDAALPKIVA